MSKERLEARHTSLEKDSSQSLGPCEHKTSKENSPPIKKNKETKVGDDRLMVGVETGDEVNCQELRSMNEDGASLVEDETVSKEREHQGNIRDVSPTWNPNSKGRQSFASRKYASETQASLGPPWCLAPGICGKRWWW